ncbi:MAG: class I SAM-dependent methyltransferase [Planctomycetes bacterium]|nr:class I SAM-dependent methyltransferase [Planctomycetota bacterium]
MLDVGTGSGRWIRYFLDRFAPLRLIGIDYTEASIDLLRKWSPDAPSTVVEFKVADITQPDLNLGEQFDLVNIANVLFHIPEPELFAHAIANLSRLVAPDGCIVTTEFMPRMTMRTDWMLVRSRYEFERAVNAAGLRIAAIRPCLFLGSAVMGIDGPENSLRARFQGIGATMSSILKSDMNEATRQYFVEFFTELDDVLVEFCKERIAPVDLPGAKFVVLKRNR